MYSKVNFFKTKRGDFCMGLSSNVLWHQTNKKGLLGIIKSKKLYYSYSLEGLLANENYLGIAFPMISLCDLPLSEFSEGKWAYGNYAIGLSRHWGMKNGFNPVCYCNQGSAYLQKMIDNLRESLVSTNIETVEKALFPFAYMKLVEGPLPRKRYKKYRFYDEKEIRLVPSKEIINGYSSFLLDVQYEKFKADNGSSLLGNLGIDFTYDDIRYLLVENNQSRKELQMLLDKEGADYSKFVILTKHEILGDIVGNNHNEEIPRITSNISVAELALKLGAEYFKKK